MPNFLVAGWPYPSDQEQFYRRSINICTSRVLYTYASGTIYRQNAESLNYNTGAFACVADFVMDCRVL